ncbi:MAG: hypothetical protein M1825_004006 [Sarcosagium campestre]|nr:MAG: hypothetical protein M1825_004006 [Sarcosagium campestre]
MSDGLNDHRAIRVAEVMNAFRSLQHYIIQAKVDPQWPEDYHEQGYAILRQCIEQAQILLAVNFNFAPTQGGSQEQEKMQLKRVLLDAHTRRFQAQKIYSRAMAARKWAISRHALLQGQKSHAGHVPALRALDRNLQADLSRVTDEAVHAEVRAVDVRAGRWVAEDATLNDIRQWMLNQR